MSWTDVFPVLSDEQVIEYQENASPGERSELEEWFGVARTVNGREARHVVAASLFWKNCNPWQDELPPIMTAGHDSRTGQLSKKFLQPAN